MSYDRGSNLLSPPPSCQKVKLHVLLQTAIVGTINWVCIMHNHLSCTHQFPFLVLSWPWLHSQWIWIYNLGSRRLSPLKFDSHLIQPCMISFISYQCIFLGLAFCYSKLCRFVYSKCQRIFSFIWSIQLANKCTFSKGR
jgi:hypothetical protein